MTPKETKKEGKSNNDMEKIIEAYNLLTEEKIEKEEKQSEPLSEPPASVRKAKDLDFSVEPREDQDSGHYTKAESIQVGENQFIDHGTEAIDVTTPKVTRSTRRPPVKMAEVKCHVCGGVEEINPQYKTGDFHRCDKCVG